MPAVKFFEAKESKLFIYDGLERKSSFYKGLQLQLSFYHPVAVPGVVFAI